MLDDIKNIFAKRFENCDNCPVDDEPDPERKCEECIRAAEEEGRTIGLHPATAQVFEIRALVRVGYRFDPDDLAWWQWRALMAVDDAIEAEKARRLEEIKNRGKK